MRAITREVYGPPEVVQLSEVERPKLGPDRVLIRVVAASVNRSDWEALTGSPGYVRVSGAGLLKPKSTRLGSDIAGVVEDVGENVAAFRPGDEVFGDILWHGGGGFADYVSVPERAPLAYKPEEWARQSSRWRESAVGR